MSFTEMRLHHYCTFGEQWHNELSFWRIFYPHDYLPDTNFISMHTASIALRISTLMTQIQQIYADFFRFFILIRENPFDPCHPCAILQQKIAESNDTVGFVSDS